MAEVQYQSHLHHLQKELMAEYYGALTASAEGSGVMDRNEREGWTMVPTDSDDELPPTRREGKGAQVRGESNG